MPADCAHNEILSFDSSGSCSSCTMMTAKAVSDDKSKCGLNLSAIKLSKIVVETDVFPHSIHDVTHKKPSSEAEPSTADTTSHSIGVRRIYENFGRDESTVGSMDAGSKVIFQQRRSSISATTLASLGATNITRHSLSNITSPSSSDFQDITRLRVSTQGRRCLVPGASFHGTQRNGASLYDVQVNILDANLPSSFLCGTLRIMGLDPLCPDVTTYFDGEIVGAKHGFLTRKWGATEADDMRHWTRFPAFNRMKPQFHGRRANITDRDRGAIFMRWKERFLVSELSRDQIPCASFDGFYYICLDFDNESSSSSLAENASCAKPVPVGPVLTGFYYHPESNPEQILCLSNIPLSFSSVFEFR